MLKQHVTQIGAALVALDVQLSLEIKSAKIYWLMHFPFPSASANFTIVSRPRKVNRASNFPEQLLEAPVHVQRPFRSDTRLTTGRYFPNLSLILSLFSSTRRCIIKFIFQISLKFILLIAFFELLLLFFSIEFSNDQSLILVSKIFFFFSKQYPK